MSHICKLTSMSGSLGGEAAPNTGQTLMLAPYTALTTWP